MNDSSATDIRFHYLIPNPTDSSYGCTVSAAGAQAFAPGDEYPARNHPPEYMFDPERGRVLHEYQLLYIVKGKGTFSNDTGSYEINKGTAILLRPGMWHTYKPYKGSGWSEYFIGFSGPMADRSVGLLFPADEQIFNVGLNREIVDLYQRAIETAATDKPAAQQLLCGIVMHMLGAVSFTMRNIAGAADRMDRIVEQAKTIMQENVLRNLDPEALAGQLNISYSWFRKIFRDYTGYPPARYFMLVKLRRAQYLLANTDESIKAIAFSLGFKSTEHFYTTFKRVTGFTPNLYRRSSAPER